MPNQWNQQPPHDGAPHGRPGPYHQPGQPGPYGQPGRPEQPGQLGAPQPAANPYAAMSRNDSSAGGVASAIFTVTSCAVPLIFLGVAILVAIITVFIMFTAEPGTSTPTDTSTTATQTY